MTLNPPALSSGHPRWDQALYAFLVEKGQPLPAPGARSESYGRMLWPFFADLRKTPDRAKPADVLAWVTHRQVKKQHGWGDGSDKGCTGPSGTRSRPLLAQLPDGDRIRAFDVPSEAPGPAPAIAVASPARREELCRIVVEQVVVNDPGYWRKSCWTPPARPFVGRQRLVPPRGSTPDLNPWKGSCPGPLDDGGEARRGV